jgi:hypothetical protein
VIFLLSAGNCPIWLNEGLAQIFEFDSAPESWQENYASFSPELNDFANLVRNASGRKEVADLYRNAHQTTLKLINHFGWNSISAILERVSKGYSFAEATEDITSYKPEEIF